MTSTVRANIYLDASGGNTSQINGMTPTAQSLQGFRNRIINGDMRIDQRNNGGSVTPNAGATYTVDRWSLAAGQNARFSVQQNAGSVTPPSGFRNYLGATSLSAYSVTSTDYFTLQQNVEGFNVADLGWGAAGAQSITVSFWVRSSLTGTFGGSINNNGSTRSYVFTYTINSANTWEFKTVVIPGDTTGTWLTTNGVGLTLNFAMGMGSTYSGAAGAWSGSAIYSATGAVSVVGTNGATFYITGVQLEAGSVATPFERRDYGRELAMCQRYFEVLNYGTSTYAALSSMLTSTANSRFQWLFKVTKRAAPTSGLQTGSWAIITPNAHASISQIEFEATNYFYATGTAGQPGPFASAEL